MRRGKEIAQGSHASLAFIINRIRHDMNLSGNSEITISLNSVEQAWLARGMAKVCLRVNSEKELLAYHDKARASGLASHLIQDSGRTEFQGVPTYTACAIGPDMAASIDQVTGDLIPY